MTSLARLLLFVSLTAAASACAERGAPERGPAVGKPGAPVVVTAQVSEGRARLELRARRSVDEVDVDVYGLDGLRVTSTKAPLRAHPLATDERATVEVRFDAPPGLAARLAVKVTTRRGPAQRVHTRAFRVGDGPRRRPPRGRLVRDGDGRDLRVLPARSTAR